MGAGSSKTTRFTLGSRGQELSRRNAVSSQVAKSLVGWTERVLRRLGRGEDGTHPVAGLTSDAAGNLNGTAMWGANANRTCGLRSVEISDNRAIHWHSTYTSVTHPRRSSPSQRRLPLESSTCIRLLHCKRDP
jgi:hypothetical protein